jgi:copper homeostasis protein
MIPAVEICTDNYEDTVNAIGLGADRIELCSDLANDGLTPTNDLMEKSLIIGRKHGVHIFPMIRCRSGNFVYTPAEKTEMIKSAIELVKMGADGIVIGALTPDSRIDISYVSEIASAVRSINPHISITFHKAIDYVRLSPGERLVDLVGTLGPYCDRVLTSGQCPTALEGASAIKEISDCKKNPRPLVAGKVRAENVFKVLEVTGANEVHSRSAEIAVALGKSKRSI